MPAFNPQDFRTWASAYDTIMKPNVDVAWVFSGKSRANEVNIEKILRDMKWEFKELRLVYDPSLMRALYWKRERGIANASSSETLFFCWKGNPPKNLPTNRLHVAPGEALYLDVMNRAPVATERDLSMVSKDQLEKMAATLGVDTAKGTSCDISEDDSSEESAGTPKKRRYPARNKGRALLRQPSTDMVPWFPLDNSPKLMQELAHESGSGLKWVFHGSPAGGCGLFGLLKEGLVVVALAATEDHGQELRKAVVNRIRQAMCTEGGTFSNPDFVKRAQELGLRSAAAKPKEKVKKEGSSTSHQSSEGEASDSSGSMSQPALKKAKQEKGTKEEKEARAKKEAKRAKKAKKEKKSKKDRKEKNRSKGGIILKSLTKKVSENKA